MTSWHCACGKVCASEEELLAHIEGDRPPYVCQWDQRGAPAPVFKPKPKGKGTSA